VRDGNIWDSSVVAIRSRHALNGSTEKSGNKSEIEFNRFKIYSLAIRTPPVPD
jgi:hypothetical protein